MILRRLTKHIKDQNWFAVGLDFFIVVVGVFIGLQVQQWSSQRTDHQREIQIVADMLADLEIDKAKYANALALGPRRIAAVNTTLEGAGLVPLSFEYDAPNWDTVSYNTDILEQAAGVSLKPEHLWTNVIIGYFPTPSTSTYDAIAGSGETKVIRDRNLVRAIQVYQNLTESVLLQNDKLIAIRGDTMMVGAKYGLAPYLQVQPDEYFHMMSEEPELAATIRILATFTIFHFGEVQSADRQATELQRQLQAYLDGSR